VASVSIARIMQRWAPVPLSPKTECRGFLFYCAGLSFTPMGRWDRPSILDGSPVLRPREVVIVIALIVALCVVAAIVLL
jgi:hypothetical protein